MSFEWIRRTDEPVMREARVASAEWSTPRVRRIVLEGAEPLLPAVEANGIHLDLLFDGDASRTFSAVVDAESGGLAIEVLVHGDGVASDWAADVQPGAAVRVRSAETSWRVTGDADWWLLVGDETALPDIRRLLELVPAGIPVRVIVTAADAEAEQVPLSTAGDLDVHWVRTPGGAPTGSAGALVAALTMTPPLLGTESTGGFAFVAAEESIVRTARQTLFAEWGLDPERAVVTGYWKRGEAADRPQHPEAHGAPGTPQVPRDAEGTPTPEGTDWVERRG